MPAIDKPFIHPRAPWVHPPPLAVRVPVAAQVQANDPTQRVSVGADGLVKLTGKVSNRGIVQSHLSLKFDGKQVTLPLSGGQTPRQVFERLQRAMPAGYSLVAGSEGKDSLSFRVMHDKLPSPVAKLPTKAQLEAALSANTFHGGEFRLGKPAQMTTDGVAKTITLSKPPKGMVGGTTLLAHVLAGDKRQVVFERNVGGRPFYMGPVSWEMLPKSMPTRLAPTATPVQ